MWGTALGKAAVLSLACADTDTSRGNADEGAHLIMVNAATGSEALDAEGVGAKGPARCSAPTHGPVTSNMIGLSLLSVRETRGAR